ncbi:flagellar hook-length control protein FliK [Roseococcus microcysteis]|uniref:flagellar hook-length control protein FliK n=1 Tax=Roseococcus microcysteis TaxID=2771361 RepID=UPI00168A721B|nr:flagellar hook-length control protein FliK [Roseococcus microcysteis]
MEGVTGLNPLAPLAPTTESPAASATPPPSPPPPMRQVAQMAVALAFSPATGSFRLALEPVELGRVEITVRREGETHRVLVMAERPETLALLQRDRQELDRALTQSGLVVEEGGIGFSLASGQGTGGGEWGGQGWERQGWGGGGGGRAAPAEPAPPEPRRAARGLLDLNI